MARRKAAGKDSSALPHPPAGGRRKSTRKRTARKAARMRKPAAKAAPRKRPPVKARKAPRTESSQESIRDDPGDAIDPALAEQAQGETALLGRGPDWWNSSLGGAKPGARVPPALRRGAGEDDPETLAVEPPIPIGIFAPRAGARHAGPDTFEEPEYRAAMLDEAPADVSGAGGEDDDEAVHTAPDEPPVAAEAAVEMPPRPPAAPPGPDARRHEPLSGIAADRDDEPAETGLGHAAPSGSGVMQMLLGTDTSRGLSPAPVARGAPLPVDDDSGRPARKLPPADLEALDAEIASSLTGMDGLDGPEELPPRNLHGPRRSAAARLGPAEPAPRSLRPAAPGREGPAVVSGVLPGAARPGSEAGAAAASATKSRSVLVAALAAFNYPMRRLPPSARRIVGWIAASLVLWVPIVWLIALYFIGR